MFTTFSQGSDDPSNWNDQPNYRPGRFHAHVLPSASTSLSTNPFLSSLHDSPTSSAQRGHQVVPSGITGATTSTDPLTRKNSKRERLKHVGGGAKRFFQRNKKGKEGEEANERHPRIRADERERLLDPTIRAPRRLFDDSRNPITSKTGPRLLASNGGGARGIVREEEEGRDDDEDEEDDSSEISWLLLRPGKKRVKRWMSSWWKRWALLVLLPCCIVWLWCSIPFPVSDPYNEEPPWHIPWPPTGDPLGSFESLLRKLPWNHERSPSTTPLVEPIPTRQVVTFDFQSSDTSPPTVASTNGSDTRQDGDGDLPVDANFYFFLVIYYGAYLAVALVFVTKLFDLYRLNWWPSSLGGAFWYTLFWTTSLSIGFLLHKFNLDGFGRRSHSRHGDHETDPTNPDSWDWERKTTWILLAFATMSMPALACFTKLRADRRNSWRRSLTPAQKTFLERQLTQRMPRSYRRFLWFLTAIALSLLTLIMGQGFATIYLSTLPHSNFEGLVYVWTLILSINLLNNVSNWILHRKVRSQSLVFIFRLLFQLTYHVFYRNLFARLRSPDQAAYITLLSSSFVILWYPLSMSKTFHRILSWTVGTSMDWPEYSHSVATMFYLRNLSENVTMVAFLGWVTILHWGPNKLIYPFFSFADPSDPYTYRLTISASLVIWIAELFSSWMARGVCWLAYGIDVTNVGLDQLRQHPDLVVACIWASTHVLMDILLFLVKLNFR
ncbi:hypothetical protein JCM16303_005707 [Sporobolomyces ruberrimus]